MPVEWMNALMGGVLIGLAVTIMLLFNGRVTGIAGIIYGVFNPQKGDFQWRFYFMAGLLMGGFILKGVMPEAFENNLSTDYLTYVIAGLLVGFGTVLGSGCTSGHGVCGISRLSPRSIVSTGLFIGAGILIVYIVRSMGVL